MSMIQRAEGDWSRPKNLPWPFLVAKQTEQPPGGLINPVIE